MESTDRENELKKLAVAFYSVPKGTAKELADAAGISKATFYRIYGSREQLGDLLDGKGEWCCSGAFRQRWKRMLPTTKPPCAG